MINTQLETGPADVGDNCDTYATCGIKGGVPLIHALSSPCRQSPRRRVELAVA